MPLIVVTGLPCSGKSTVARKIRDFFLQHYELKDPPQHRSSNMDGQGGSQKEKQARDEEQRLNKKNPASPKKQNKNESSKGVDKKVRLVTDGRRLNKEGRYGIYQHANREKELRAWLKGEVSRYVNQGDVVILDAACYIKGFRYELFCISKEAKTQYCVVECHPPVELCLRRNQEHCDRQSAKCYEPESEESQDNNGEEEEDSEVDVNDEKDSTGYDKATFDALIQRYEKCNEKDRWDSPLFPVVDEEGKDLDINKIYEFITKSKPLIPHKSTDPPKSQPLNFYQELDSTTSKVVETILKYQKITGTSSGVVTIPGASEKFSYKKAMSSAELGRFKRQFIAYTKLHPIQDGSSVTELFVQYLNSVVN